MKHLIPTIGLRMEFANGRIAAYSCDTEPCAAVMRLGYEADLLLHEAVGEARGHSSGAQAADIARQAEVKRLVLIHYPVEKGLTILEEAHAVFAERSLWRKMVRFTNYRGELPAGDERFPLGIGFQVTSEDIYGRSGGFLGLVQQFHA